MKNVLKQKYGISLMDVIVECAELLTVERGDFTYNQIGSCVYHKLRKIGVDNRDLPKLDTIKRKVRLLKQKGILEIVGSIERRFGENQLLFAVKELRS